MTAKLFFLEVQFLLFHLKPQAADYEIAIPHDERENIYNKTIKRKTVLGQNEASSFQNKQDMVLKGIKSIFSEDL